MDTSVIGIYKSSANAQSAMNELLKTGISKDDMQLTGGGQAQASGGVMRSLKEETGVGEFYRTMHGRSDTQSYAQAYDQAAGQGNAILTVHAPSEDMAHRAAEVMERFNPIDVEEYASSGMQDDIQEGRSQSPDAAMTSGPSAVGVRQGKGTTSGSQQSTTSTGKKGAPTGTSASLESSDGTIRDDIQKGRPLDMRKGVRMYQRSSGAPVQRTEDSRFRSHWQNVYGSSGGKYDDYGPAYRYGSELRSNERWRGKQWSEMESDVRSDWEAKNQKGMWEKFKDSIRYGWENATGTYEDETRALGDRMEPGMGAERGIRAGSAATGTVSGRETSRPSTSVSPGIGTGTTGPDTRKPGSMSGGMSTSGASFMSEEEKKRGVTASSSGMQDDVQKGRKQSPQAAATAGSSGERAAQPSSTSGKSASVSGGGAHVPDDVEYRSHWQHSYWTSGGSYDDYAPAYRYGADYADNDTNPNHQWSDVETRMRGDWEAYNRDPGSWDKNKEAIRYGWEKGKQRGKGTHSGHALR